jgi:hypothetical protein
VRWLIRIHGLDSSLSNAFEFTGEARRHDVPRYHDLAAERNTTAKREGGVRPVQFVVGQFVSVARRTVHLASRVRSASGRELGCTSPGCQLSVTVNEPESYGQSSSFSKGMLARIH